MKTITIAILFALCLTASATMYRGPNGYRKDSLPTTIKGVRSNVPASYWLDSGEYWVESTQELAERNAEQTKAEAEAGILIAAEAKAEKDKEDAVKNMGIEKDAAKRLDAIEKWIKAQR